jgi:Major capsid protein N-terminus/Large eukaryotic DNA virus major capsid protein
MAGNVLLVAYNDENMFLNDEPQISYFKIIYKRYTNFSIETIRTEFLYKPDFGQKYSAELSKYGDLISKTWLVIELPPIPIILNLNGNPDEKLKFAWARKIGYVLINYIEVIVGGTVIQKQWGEWMNAMDELNTNNYNSSMDQYVGNLPELYEFKSTTSVRPSYTLHIPLRFFFCEFYGTPLPVLCLNYSSIIINVKMNDFSMCSVISPTNFIEITEYYGNGIFNEPLVQITSEGIAWGTFDSLDIINTDTKDYKVNKFNLYYRKISDLSFSTTDSEYFKNIDILKAISNFLNSDKKINYLIYGLYSKSIYIPISNLNLSSNNIENTYFYTPLTNISLIQTYLLVDYIFLDRDERKKFYDDKHEYIIEQIYFSGGKTTDNLTSKFNLEIINPCKWMLFMGQLSYMNSPNVNDFFNYTNTFIRNPITNLTVGQPIIKTSNILLNSQTITGENNFEFYNIVQPFLKFPKCYYPFGFGLYSFSLYPSTFQQSGSVNMSCFSNIELITRFNNTDVQNNYYILKVYAVTLNVFKVLHGVGSTIFYSNY